MLPRRIPTHLISSHATSPLSSHPILSQLIPKCLICQLFDLDLMPTEADMPTSVDGTKNFRPIQGEQAVNGT